MEHFVEVLIDELWVIGRFFYDVYEESPDVEDYRSYDIVQIGTHNFYINLFNSWQQLEKLDYTISVNQIPKVSIGDISRFLTDMHLNGEQLSLECQHGTTYVVNGEQLSFKRQHETTYVAPGNVEAIYSYLNGFWEQINKKCYDEVEQIKDSEQEVNERSKQWYSIITGEAE